MIRRACRTQDRQNRGLAEIALRTAALLICTIAAGSFIDSASGQALGPDVRFVACDDCGIEPYHMFDGFGGGVAAADVNNNGFVDLFVPTSAGHPHQFYVNNGDGTFTEHAADAGLALLEQGRTALWFDYDGDGLLDLIIASDDPALPTTYRLFRHTEGLIFEEVTEAAGLFMPLPAPMHPGDPPHRGGMAAGDLTGNGWLDLVTCLWNGQVQIFFNNGDGTFADATADAGVTASVNYPWQPLLLDLNRDGWLDIYLAVDFRWNGLFINQGDGTFVDVALQVGADSAWNDMGIAAGDFDRDGLLDLYITNITAPGTHNVLYRNQSFEDELLFVDVAQVQGVDDGGWGWGCTFLDADNNGWLDIAATNGFHLGSWVNDPSRFFWNRRGALPGQQSSDFIDASDVVGFNNTYWGSALIAADLDRDGRMDLVQACRNGPLLVLFNQRAPARGRPPGGRNWLTIQPRQDGPNAFAIGAELRLVVDGQLPQTRLITAGTSFLGQEPAEAHFGLGAIQLVDRVEIIWPDGECTRILDVSANQIITVHRAQTMMCDQVPGDANGDGLVNVLDLLIVLTSWGPCVDCSECHGDLSGPEGEPDCQVDVADLLEVLSNWGAAS